jgi:hypothetical protein
MCRITLKVKNIKHVMKYIIGSTKLNAPTNQKSLAKTSKVVRGAVGY